MLIAALVIPATASADIESLLAAGIPVKCGTPYILEEQANKTTSVTAFTSYRISGMDHFALSAEGHFRVHFNTAVKDTVDVTDLSGNGIPDYVDSALVYLEYAYDVIVDSLGFKPPLPDGYLGGGPETDIYLRNLGNVYGQTFTVTSMRDGNTCPAYIEIDNDFSESIYASNGLDALKVTTAHEFFHAVQFRLYSNLDLNWWQEHTAVWMEDYVWDEVNDYFAYLKYFFTYQNVGSDGRIIWDARDMPLDSRNGSFEYGAAVWAHYLAKRFGTGIIKTIWDHQASIGSADIDDFEGSIPGGLVNALGEFAVWNYFTKNRGNGIDFYPDSPLFPVKIAPDTTLSENPALGSLSAPRLTSRYVEFLFGGEWHDGDTLRIAVTPLNGGTFENFVILYNSPTDYRLCPLSSPDEDILLDGMWDRAVLVTACGNTSGIDYEYSFETEIIKHAGDSLPLAFSLDGTFPNPFNSSTTVAFTVPDEGGQVDIKAYNATGQKVADVFTGNLDGGEKRLIWQPEKSLAGGLYFITVSGRWGTKTVKTLFLK